MPAVVAIAILTRMHHQCSYHFWPASLSWLHLSAVILSSATSLSLLLLHILHMQPKQFTYILISFVISKPRSRDSSALEFIFPTSRSWSRDLRLNVSVSRLEPRGLGLGLVIFSHYQNNEYSNKYKYTNPLLPWNLRSKWPIPFRTPRFRPTSTHSASTVTTGKKSSISTNSN